MREDLIERLLTDADLIHDNGITRKLPRHRVAALLREAAAALEAAREALDREAALKGGVEHQRDTLWAELEAAREDAWQPIETAPKEGEVLLQTSTGSVRVDDCRTVHWFVAMAEFQKDACWYVAWRPLPAIDQARGKGVAE